MHIRTEIEINKYRNRKRNKFIFSCDKCGGEFSQYQAKARYNLKEGIRHSCPTCFDWQKIALDRSKNKASKLEVGEKWPDSYGYMVVRIGLNSNYSGVHHGKRFDYIREHVKVMQDHLGRKLIKGEIIHHIDGNKENNKIDNLDLCTQTQHNQCHALSEEIVFELYKKGLVGYDSTTKRYFLK